MAFAAAGRSGAKPEEIRAAIVNNRRYLVGVPFLFQWVGFCILSWGFVVIVWILTALFTWTAIDPAPAMMQYAVVIVVYPLLAPLLARVRPRDATRALSIF